MPDWSAIALRAAFRNPFASLPGKTAEKVLAKITYTDQTERHFPSLDGGQGQLNQNDFILWNLRIPCFLWIFCQVQNTN